MISLLRDVGKNELKFCLPLQGLKSPSAFDGTSHLSQIGNNLTLYNPLVMLTSYPLQLILPLTHEQSTHELFIHVSLFFRKVPLISIHAGSFSCWQSTTFESVQVQKVVGFDNQRSPGFLWFCWRSRHTIIIEHSITYGPTHLHTENGFGLHSSPTL